ncbi:hypothetical protein, partial [Brachybacterium alimentarium]|uniref:hypothetical protein n=1 Tax=Brachybacterium alimentarium TaxID=47845 RepID=UPI003F8E0671
MKNLRARCSLSVACPGLTPGKRCQTNSGRILCHGFAESAIFENNTDGFTEYKSAPVRIRPLAPLSPLSPLSPAQMTERPPSMRTFSPVIIAES